MQAMPTVRDVRTVRSPREETVLTEEQVLTIIVIGLALTMLFMEDW